MKAKRQAGTVLISYKSPMLEMLEDFKEDIKSGFFSTSQIDQLLQDFFDKAMDDGWNCDDDEIRDTAWLAHRAKINVANALAFEPFNYRTVAIQQIQQVKNKYESLDENKICGEVESGTPLSIYALNGNSGSFFGLKPLI